MRLARQRLQHASSLDWTLGFAQDLPPQGHGGVGAQHRGRGQVQIDPALHGGLQFESSHALHIRTGRFTGQDDFQALGIFMRLRQQQLMRHAHLIEQLTPPRAL